MSLYADDTCLNYASSNPLDLEKYVNEDLNSISKWLNCNELLLNENNITPTRKKRLFNNIQVKINNSCIQKTNTCKYLGVTVNDTLRWNNHMSNIRGKLPSALYCFKRLRPFISQDTALILYNGLIQPHLDNCSIVWRNAGKTLIDQISVEQKRALRDILLVDNRLRSHALYKFTGVKLIEIRWTKQAAVFIFKIFNKLLPQFICNKIIINTYHLRNSRNVLELNKPRTNFYETWLHLFYHMSQKKWQSDFPRQ